VNRFNAAAKLTAGLIFSTVFLAACGGGGDDGNGGGGDPADVPLSQSPALVQQYAAQLNNARASSRNCGTVAMPAVPSLSKWNSKLQSAAQKHADDMAANSFFSHTGSDGSTADSREDAAGYSGIGIGENLAGARGTPAAITNAWLNSQGHCITVMSEEATTLAVAQKGQYTVLMTGK